MDKAAIAAARIDADCDRKPASRTPRVPGPTWRSPGAHLVRGQNHSGRRPLAGGMRKIVLLLATCLLPLPAWAAPANVGPTLNEDGDRVTQRGEERYIEIDEGDNIDGLVLSPLHERISSRPLGANGSMIRLRSNFIGELIEASHNI